MSRLVALRGRRRRLALMLVAITVLLAFVAGPARAIPPRCQDGSPPPCEGPEDPPPPPDPDPEPPRPPTTPTTAPAPAPIPPPTTVPPPPPPAPTWKLNVLMLDQDDGALGPVGAERYWMYEPVAHPGNLVDPGQVSPLDTIPAGTSGLENGQFSFPDYPLPTGMKMVLKVTEGGSPGVLCRTVPRSALPFSGTSLHILVAPPVTTGAADLQSMVAGFSGPVTSGLPAGVTMNIDTANLSPQTNGVMLQLLGTLAVDQFNYTFDYHMLLTLVPATGTDLSYVLYPQTVGPGTVELTSVGEPNGDFLIETIKTELLPKMKTAVGVKALPAVNDAVHLDHDVQWWRDQGFNVSMRRVTYSATGMTLYPSLCRLG